MKVIIAPDKFKGSLTSFEFCEAVEQGLRRLGLGDQVVSFPLADGGDGFAAVMRHYLQMETVECEAVDPLHRPMTGSYQWSPQEKTAIVELAVASGISLLGPKEVNPLLTSTYGTGMIIQHSIRAGAKRIILGVGGSATNDAGMGLLSALGFRFLDRAQHELVPNGEALQKLDQIVPPAHLPAIHWEISCDVVNPFYGKNGAAYVYAPQKGATEKQVRLLDEGLQNFSRVVLKDFGTDISNYPGAGAAGGVAGGLLSLLKAELHSGIEMVIKASNLENQIAGASLIVTGEGRLDSQSMQGKVVGRMASLAKQYEVPCIAFCGKLDLSEAHCQALGLTHAYEIADEQVSISDRIKNAGTYLTNTSYDVLRKMLLNP
jgi:glycerate kinase